MRHAILTSAALLAALAPAAFAQPAQAPDSPSGMAGSGAASGMRATHSNTTSAQPGSQVSSPVSSGVVANIPAGEELGSKVIGLDIYNSANQNIGKIKDIAFDNDGVKAYIVSVGGFLGMGDRYVAVTPSAVNLSYDAGARKWHAAMNTDASQLKSAPEYKYSSND